jgi:hypothetical protein
MQFKILTCLENDLKEKFVKLNKKCQKYGNTELSFSVVKTYEEDNMEWSDIIVSGITPKIGDYELVSVISILDDGTRYVANIPGKETPIEYREGGFFCDHCNINRYRKEVVIVYGNGEYKQLGKTCLKDYLGIDLENLVNQFTWIYELITEAQDSEYAPREVLVVDPLFFLERVAVCVRKLGYTSGKAAYENPDLTPTKSHAWEVCFPNSFSRKWIEANELFVEDQDKEMAQKALGWALNLEGKNDFEYNVKNVAKQDRIGYKHIGYISAAIPCYQKSVATELEKKNTVKSEWIGAVKERLTITVTCVFTKEIYNEDDRFGNNLKTLVKFVTKDGESITWFASGEVDYKMGESYLIKATVTKHDEYQGVKQTMVNRVKAIAEKV